MVLRGSASLASPHHSSLASHASVEPEGGGADASTAGVASPPSAAAAAWVPSTPPSPPAMCAMRETTAFEASASASAAGAPPVLGDDAAPPSGAPRSRASFAVALCVKSCTHELGVSACSFMNTSFLRTRE